MRFSNNPHEPAFDGFFLFRVFGEFTKVFDGKFGHVQEKLAHLHSAVRAISSPIRESESVFSFVDKS